ncbi:hypothetical protein AZZ68_000747, partial [Klebsiella pneumoniae]
TSWRKTALTRPGIPLSAGPPPWCLSLIHI